MNMAFIPKYKIGTVIAGKFMFLGFHLNGKEIFEQNVFIIKLENKVKRDSKFPYIVQRVQILTETGSIRSYRRMLTKDQVRIPSLGEVVIPWSLFSQENNKGEEIKMKQTSRRYTFYDDDSLKKSALKY